MIHFSFLYKIKKFVTNEKAFLFLFVCKVQEQGNAFLEKRRFLQRELLLPGYSYVGR